MVPSVTHPPASPPMGDGESWSQRAMEWSQTASLHLRQDRLEESIFAYHQALDLYQQRTNTTSTASSSSLSLSDHQRQHNPKQLHHKTHNNGKHQTAPQRADVISLCNAGSCWRNLGAIHRKRQATPQALEAFQRAEQLYRHGRDVVWDQRVACTAEALHSHQPVVSLDAYLVETLQSRATLHSRPGDAMECHEEVLDVLLEAAMAAEAAASQRNNNSDEDEDSHDRDDDISRNAGSSCWYAKLTEPLGTVMFGPMDADKLMEHLLVSLTALGALYTTTGDYQDGLDVFVQAVDYARQRRPRTAAWTTELLKIQRTLAELYLEKQDWHAAGKVLLDALDVTTSSLSSVQHEASPLPDGELLDALDRMGKYWEEEEEDYEMALSFYERVLLTRNQFLGDAHVDVAKSLIHVARIMELQGNQEGSLDLYRAAQAIYTRQVTSHDFRVASEDVPSLLQLIPNVMEQGRYEEAVAYLNKCLESNDKDLDKTQIYFDLGQSYIGMGDYVSATVCLVECAKQDGAVSDEQISQLLDHVEFLKQEQEAAFSRSHVFSSEGQESEDTPEDTRSEEENRSLTSLTSRSPLPLSSPSDSEVDDPLEAAMMPLPLVQTDVLPERKPLSPKQSPRELANTFAPVAVRTPSPAIKADAVAAGDDYASEDPLLWTSDGHVAGDDEDEKHHATTGRPRDVAQSAWITPDRVRSPSAVSSKFSLLSAQTPSAIEESLSPLEVSSESDRTPPLATNDSGPQVKSDSDQVDSTNDSQAMVEYHRPNLEVSQSADTRGLLEPSDGEDEIPSPTARQSSKGKVSRSRSIGSPRKKKASSPRWKIESKGSDTKEKKNPFRRRKRNGFESLQEEKPRTPSPLTKATAQLERENEYHLDDSSYLDAPVQVIEVEPNWDDVSEISFNPNGRSGSHKHTNEWWWGVTAEGFGRWFPSNFVSQAVEAADGFLSAKAIHSKVKSAPLHISDDEESAVDRESQPTEEYASHIGVSSKKHVGNTNESTEASRADIVAPLDTTAGNLGAMLSPQSPVRRKRSDVLSDIRECSQQIAQQKMKLDENDPALGDTLFRLALLHGQNQNIASAAEAATSALRIQKLNSKFVTAARTLHFLAGLQLQERQYKSALSLYSEALRMETNLYGKYSEECAKTLNAIGTVRSMQNEFKLAMDSHKEALHVLKECHGEDVQGNPLVSQTLCQIGAVYYRERNALSTIKSKGGDYTTFIEAGMLEIIGRAHEERGSYKMAIAFFEEKLQFLQNAPKSEATQDELATTLNSLGMLSSRAGLFMEAVDYYEKALAIQMDIENDVVYMSTAKVLMATVQFQLGFWHKSLQLFQEALPILQGELTAKHETVAATMYHIGVTQAAMCDYDAAMTSFSDAYAVQESLLGVAHPASLRTRREMGNLYAIYTSELDYSFDIFSQVLAAQQSIHGLKHPNIAETLHSIGVAYAHKGQDATALKTLEECYYMRLEFLGVDHPLQATTLHEIAKIHMKKGRARKATSICETVLEIRRESLSDLHIDYARALATKGSSLSMRGEFVEASGCLDEALRLAQQSVPASHPAIGEVHLEMGLLWLRKCQFNEARTCVELAQSIFRKSNFDDDHPGLLRVRDLLQRIERDEALYV